MEYQNSHFLSLPTELLLRILKSFVVAAEPSRLAQSCRRLHRVYNRYQIDIEWYILTTSQYHKYDISLSFISDLMHGDEADIALKEPTVTQPMPYDWLRGFLSPDSTLHSSRRAKSDGRDICLRRVRFWWKQVDRLRKFYITHMVNYRQSISYHSADHLPPGLKDTYTIACYAGCRWSVGELVSPLLNASEEGEISAERFYRAVIARTLDTKALQGLAIFAEIENSEIGGHTYDQIIKMWSENPDRTLQESLEVLEIFDYTSNFLLLDIFDCPGEHLDWVDDRQKSELMDAGETFLRNWMDFHTRLQSFLTPLDIFSLSEKNNREGTKCFKGSVTNYLLKFLLINAVDSYQTVPGMAQVEQDVARKLGDIRPGTWEFFRSHYWRSTIRGLAFTETFEGIDIDKVMHFKQDASLWWKDLRRVDADFPDTSLPVCIIVPRYLLVPFRELVHSDEEPDIFDLEASYVLDYSPTEHMMT